MKALRETQTFEPYWKADALARYLNVQLPTIRYWVHIGYLPHIKFKGAVRFDPPTIREWVETLKKDPVATMSEEVANRITKKDDKDEVA